MNSKKNSQLGKKILYVFVITMSALILLLNVAGIFGVWMVGGALGNATIAVLKVVENTANTVQKSTAKVDDSLVRLQDKVTEITDATQKLSANVSDKGLVLVLLPEEREQQLTDRASSVRDTLNGIKETLSKVVDLYRSVDAMPFINLPSLDKDQQDQLDQALDQTQSGTGTLRSAIIDFRSGVTNKVDKVEEAANKLNERIQNARDRVAKLDARMAALEEFSQRAQSKVKNIFTIFSVIFTLLFAFVIWTQVEIIRQYAARWRLLSEVEAPVILPVEIPAVPVVEPAPLPAAKPAKPKAVKKAAPAKKAKPVKPAKSPKKKTPSSKKK